MRSIKLTLKSLVVVAALFAVSATMTSCEKESNSKQILGFGFTTPAAVGVIDEAGKTVKVAVPEGTDITALSPIISVSEKATVSPASGVVTNFTNPVQYTVTAEDGSTAAYTVTVTIGAGGEPVELTSPITTNTTLKDLGLPIDYFFNGDGVLEVKNNAILTIEEGVCIQFRKTGGSLAITDGATIKALGTSNKRIQFVGGTAKGSWDGLVIETSTDNQLQYVDVLNAGDATDGAISVYYQGSKVSITNSNISGSLGHGLYLANNGIVIAAFSNNIITGCEKTPVHMEDLFSAEKFDATSNLIGNGENYVYVTGTYVEDKNLTLNGTTVPYYVEGGINVNSGRTFTINKGTTIIIGNNRGFNVNDGAHIIVNGGTGVGEKVTFTHLPGSTYYWSGFEFFGSYGNVIKNAVIEYGGAPNNDANINAYFRSEVTLENVEIKHSKKFGVSMYYNNGGDASIVKGTATFSGNVDSDIWDYTTNTAMSNLPE